MSQPRPTPTTGGTASNLKTQTETWFNNNSNFTDAQRAQVAEGKYCNDRKPQTGQSYGTSNFNYAAYERLVSKKTPTLECDAQDVYTLTAGAITADEVSMAGGVCGTGNSSYYLYNGQLYWTMSPSDWIDSYAYVFRVSADGRFGGHNVNWDTPGIRPIINIKSSVNITGEGTQDKPYIVE